MVVRRSAGLLVALFISTKASAQTPAATSQVPVTFRAADAGGTLRIQGPGIAANEGYCPAACTLNIARGNYTVYFSSSGKTTPLNVAVHERSEVVVSPANSFQRGFGLSLILVGGAVAGLGAFAFYYDQTSKLDERRFGDLDSRYRYSTPDWVLPLEIAGGVGAGVAVVGMVVFFTASPSLEVFPKRSATAPRRSVAAHRSRFHLVPALGPRGGGVRLESSF